MKRVRAGQSSCVDVRQSADVAGDHLAAAEHKIDRGRSRRTTGHSPTLCRVMNRRSRGTRRAPGLKWRSPREESADQGRPRRNEPASRSRRRSRSSGVPPIVKVSLLLQERPRQSMTRPGAHANRPARRTRSPPESKQTNTRPTALYARTNKRPRINLSTGIYIANDGPVEMGEMNHVLSKHTKRLFFPSPALEFLSPGGTFLWTRSVACTSREPMHSINRRLTR